jgi:[ribosomal protein S5]-alanine N-acetyltransferase
MTIDPPILTERLQLRCLDAGDCGDHYLAWMADPDVQRFLESRGSSHTADSLRSYVSRLNVSDHSLLLGMFERRDLRHIGNIKLGPIDRRHERASLGLMIGDRDAWGQGFGTEAVRALCGYAISTLGLKKIVAGIYDDNVASRHLFERAGFREDARLSRHAAFEGRRIDVLLMALHA